MGDRLEIGQLRTRIRCEHAADAQQLAARVHALGARELPQALQDCAARALAQAGLPATAVVAVRRLALHLRVGAGVQALELAAGWAASLEAALARLLSGLAPGDEAQATVVWFAERWTAERRHLERRAAGEPDAWWADELLPGTRASSAGGLEAAEPLSILQRWLERDPGRAVLEMAALARSAPRLAALVEASQAMALARRLIEGFAAAPVRSWVQAPRHAPPAAAASADRSAASTDGAGTDRAPRGDVDIDGLLAGLDDVRAGLSTFATPDQRAPWLAALLLAAHPSASCLGAARLFARVRAAADASAAEARSPVRTTAAQPTPRAVTADAPAPAATATAARDTSASPSRQSSQSTLSSRVHAAGLLLFLRPLARLALLERCANPGRAAGVLALSALQRVFAPLAAGARMAALERERPLLAVFAPECDWHARIAETPVSATEARAAAEQLDALVEAIPAGLSFAPGASREIFGMPSPPCASAAEHRLAGLLLRPGMLHVRAWEAEIEWPLASIDLALRRAGWDQDPGWVPRIGRTIRLRYGDGT